MKRRIFAAILLVSLLCGCANTAAPTETNPDTAVYFVDDLGRTVTVNQPRRVATLLGSFAEVWTLSGGTVCAAPEDAWDDFGLELPDTIHIGGAHSPSLEQLLSADPDFVIASASTASNVALRETLEAAGIPVAYFDVDNFEDYLRMLDICTDITRRKDLYEQNGTALARQIDELKKLVSDAQLPEERRTVLLLRAASGFVKAKGSEGTILGEMLADLGCINIADSDTSLLENLSVESVIWQNPYRIFVVTMGNDTQKAQENLEKMFRENPAWGTLEAVQQERLYLMDRKLFNIKPNARWAESYEILTEILLGA